MNKKIFNQIIIILGFTFAVVFSVIVIPPFFNNPDVFGAFAAGFVNPYSTGYSLDTIFCWIILAVSVIHEQETKKIKYGWIALVLGVVPGVATGIAFYLWLRMRHENQTIGKKEGSV